MCGIVGYVGKARCTEVLLKGLSHLEYRGYDSAGLALHTDSGIEQLRRVGRLNRLNEGVKEHDADFIRVRAGGGHTRWATHGRPTETNAHPHLGGEGTVAVVHNGIIENHAKLRDTLERDGYEFRSETDTEVIAHLIAHEMRKDATLREAMAEALRRFEGSFAVAAVSIAEPETIVAARSHSPLVIGLGEGESWEEGYSERRPSPTSRRPRPAARKWWSFAREGDSEAEDASRCLLRIPEAAEILEPIVSIIPLQLLAYRVAKARDLDVDKPRNLAKSVTVE